MNIYERMEEIIRDGEISTKGKVLYGFTFDYDGLIDGDILSVIYECNNCGESTENFEYIEEIADWIE